MSQADEIRLLKMINEQQAARIREQEETITELRAVIGELRALKANLEETIEEFRRKFFGVRSEKTAPSSEDTGQETPTKKISVKSHTRERKKKAARDDLYAALPVREVKCPVPEEDRNCPYCNAPMETLGYKFVREELRITPAKIERIRYLQETVICPECKKDGDGTLTQAPVPPALLKHSPASPSIVAHIMYQRNFNSMPYYRQETDMEQLGAVIPRETMARWYLRSAGMYFYPIYEKLHEQLVLREVLHADEVPCQVLHEEGKTPESKSYMWVYLTGNDGLSPIILYEYQPGRKGCYPKEFLKGFKGKLQCDGYTGYNQVEDVTLVCCLAHCRRKFYEALPEERRKTLKLLDINSCEELKEPEIPEEDRLEMAPPAEIGLAYCNRLFFLERQLKEKGLEERKAARIEQEIPVWNQFWKWIDRLSPVGGSKLEKAVNYAQNHHETLMNYLLDGRCEISNNRAERRCKSYAIGRKNSLFHNSAAGAEASAIIYSMVETAKASHLNVFQYLYTVLLYMPDYKNEPAGIEQLLPWSEFIRKHCTGLTDTETMTPENKPKLPL